MIVAGPAGWQERDIVQRAKIKANIRPIYRNLYGLRRYTSWRVIVQVIVGKSDVKSLHAFTRLSARLEKGTLSVELHRGVVDAGRKTKTAVQRAVHEQMALMPGNYQGYVVAGTRGVPRRQLLAFDIFGVKGGGDIEMYRGLRAVKASSRLNKGRIDADRGMVRSGVWGNPRVFKRSFVGNAGGHYAMLPPGAGSSNRAPKALWTFGLKPDQPRGARGRFTSSGVKYGKVRKLFGPSLMKEIPEDESLATFYRVGVDHLEREVTKRLTKLMRF